MWEPLDMHHPSKHCYRSTWILWQGHIPMVVGQWAEPTVIKRTTTRAALEVLYPNCVAPEPSLIHGGGSMDLTLSGISHRCSVWLGSGNLEVGSPPLGHIPWVIAEQFMQCCRAYSPAEVDCCHQGVPLPWGGVLGHLSMGGVRQVASIWMLLDSHHWRFPRRTLHFTKTSTKI